MQRKPVSETQNEHENLSHGQSESFLLPTPPTPYLPLVPVGGSRKALNSSGAHDQVTITYGKNYLDTENLLGV